MKERENYFVLFLAIGIGILAFLSYDIVARMTESKGKYSKPVFSPLVARPRMTPSAPQIEPEQNFFLTAYTEKELQSFRNIFSASIEVPAEEELLVTAEQPGSTVEAGTPEETGETGETPPQEEIPQVTVKGMVTSPQGRAVIVEIDGKILILTSQKPLQGGVKLIKVEGKQVILEYQGRELTFSLSD